MKKSPFLIISIFFFVLSGCGGGMPTSLDEHIALACEPGWNNIQDLLSTSEGQEKDLIKAQLDEISQSNVCACTAKVVKLGSSYIGDEQCMTGGGCTNFNEQLGEYINDGTLENVYESLKVYELEETLPAVQLVYEIASQSILQTYGACVDGLDPSTLEQN